MNTTGSLISTTSTCTICAGQHYPCGTGRTWPSYTGPCIACGTETRTSALCGHPHCTDCREPGKLPDRKAEPAAGCDVNDPSTWAWLPDVVPDETEQQGMARTYSLVGWTIFPLWWVEDGRCACRQGAECKSPGKHPLYAPAHKKGDPKCYGACGKLGHGLYDATADPEVNARRWAETPRANIGMPAHGNGFAIIDIDPKSGGDETFANLLAIGLDEGVDLTATLAQHTGGGGNHYLYAAPENGIKNNAKSFGDPGVDTRGVGGYIVVAPSNHLSGDTYQWVDFSADVAPWPGFLTDLMNPPAVFVPPPTPTRGTGDGRGYGAKAIDNEVAILLSTGEGGRNDQLNRSAFNLGQLVGMGKVGEKEVTDALTAAAHRIGLGTREISQSIASGLSNGKANPRTRGGAR